MRSRVYTYDPTRVSAWPCAYIGKGYADIRVASYLYRHESRCFLEQYIHLHIADPFYRTAGHLIASDGEFQGEDNSQRDA